MHRKNTRANGFTIIDLAATLVAGTAFSAAAVTLGARMGAVTLAAPAGQTLFVLAVLWSIAVPAAAQVAAAQPAEPYPTKPVRMVTSGVGGGAGAGRGVAATRRGAACRRHAARASAYHSRYAR